MIIPATEKVNRAEIEMVIQEESAARKNHYNNISIHIQIEVGRYAFDHSIQDALKEFFKKISKIYLQTFIDKVVANIIKEEWK